MASTPGDASGVPDPLSPTGSTEVTIVDVVSHGYRLRLVDHPPAFDRAGYYGEPGGGDYPDNAWRFGLFCRAALEVLRTDNRPIDVLHLHDWHAAPAVILRDRFYVDDPIVGPAAALITIHNLAYHGWVERHRLGQLGLAPGDTVVAPDAVGIDLLGAGIERSELANTVSPGYAAEALTPGVRDGPRRDAPAQGEHADGRRDAVLLRHPQRARHRAVEPGRGHGPGGSLQRGGPWPARRPAGPICSSGTGWTRPTRLRSSG